MTRLDLIFTACTPLHYVMFPGEITIPYPMSIFAVYKEIYVTKQTLKRNYVIAKNTRLYTFNLKNLTHDSNSRVWYYIPFPNIIQSYHGFFVNASESKIDVLL